MSTEHLMDTCSPSTPPAEPSVVGYFSVPPQGAIRAARCYPVGDGESTIGRDEDCPVCIPVRALSRQHAVLLVEDGEHFILDLGSRNCTLRRGVRLKPDRYYEVTNGTELTFADVKCQYFIGQPPTNQIAATEPVAAGGAPEICQETTQPQESGGSEEGEGEGGEGEGEKQEREEEGDEGEGGEGEGGEGEGGEEEKGGEPQNDESTQAYPLDREEEQMEFEEPFKLTRNTTALMDSPPSSPLLGGGGQGEGEGGVVTAEDVGKNGEGGAEEGEKKKEREEEGEKQREEEEVGEGEKAEEKKKPGQKVSFFGVSQEDSGSETEGEGEREEEERNAFEYEDTVPYPMDDPGLLDDGGDSSDGAGPFESRHDDKDNENGPTVPYDIANEEDDTENNKRESKQQQDASDKQDSETGNKEQSASEVQGVAPDNDQTLAYEVDTETDSDSDTEVRSKVESTSNLATDGAQTNDIPSTSSIKQSRKNRSTLRDTTPPEEKGKNDASPTIKSDSESIVEESELEEENPVPVATTTTSVSRTTRSRQKTLVIDIVRGEGRGRRRRGKATPLTNLDSGDADSAEDVVETAATEVVSKGRRGRGRGRGRGKGTPLVSLQSAEKEAVEDDEDEEFVPSRRGRRGKGRGRGKGRETPSLQTLEPVETETVDGGGEPPKHSRRRKGRKGGGRKAEFLLESSEEQTTTTDAASGGESAVEEKEEKNTSSALPLPPPSSAVSMVRRIVEGMTLKSEKSRLRGTDDVTPATVAMETVESLDIGADSGSGDSHVMKAGGSCEPKPSPPASSSLRGSTCDVRDDQSDRGSVTSSETPSVAGGGRERGRGRGKTRVKKQKPATPRASNTPRLQTRVSRTPNSSKQKPKVMYTGVVDRDGEETVRSLGGEMVDSVFECTHLVTDKVRRTVKFLCCLARGCHIVNDQWLDHCREEGRFLPPEAYLVKDRTAERQHKFTLSKSVELAGCSKLLSGQKVFLSPSIKPPPSEMGDIITCSGGEVLTTLPQPPGVGVIIVASPDDLSMLNTAVEAGMAIYSTELILGGVLRQELDLTAHQLSVGGASSSGPAPSSSAAGGGGRRKRKTTEDADITTTRPSTKRRRK